MTDHGQIAKAVNEQWALRAYDVMTVSNSPDADSDASFKRIGVAFKNSDGSFNIILDVLPLDGRLHMRARQNGGRS